MTPTPRLRIDIITAVPDATTSPLETSIVGRARAAGLVEIIVHPLRDYAPDRHRTIDDYPFGGGAGMILKPEPIVRAVEAARAMTPGPHKVLLLSPQGRRFEQGWANDLSCASHLILICGHYRAVDARVAPICEAEELSIGDYVLSGGELPALLVVDAVVRLVPGVLGDAESALDDSFQNGGLDCPWYTRPREFRGVSVPEVLLSGDHADICDWRAQQALRATALKRPDLLTMNDETPEGHRVDERRN
jgi:tRNA (guanine37-N1)-methyltransferase